MLHRRRMIALAAVTLSAGCDGADDASNNNNNGPPPNPMYVEHMIESVTLDASENTVTVSGVYRPSEAYAVECAPHGLGTSEIVHVIALYPDADDYRPGVLQYSDATSISAEEYEARAAAAWLNEFYIPIQLNGIERITTGSVHRVEQGVWQEYSRTQGSGVAFFYSNGTSTDVDLFCGACTARGTCGDGWCDSGEETSCWQDCPAPLVDVCGDGWCAPSEVVECPTDCPSSP